MNVEFYYTFTYIDQKSFYENIIYHVDSYLDEVTTLSSKS